MSRKTREIRSEFQTLRQDLALMGSGSASSRWEMGRWLCDRPIDCHRGILPVQSPLPPRMWQGKNLRSDGRRRLARFLWVMMGIGMSGLVALWFWRSLQPIPIPMANPTQTPLRADAHRGRSHVNPSSQPSSPIDIDQLERLEPIPAPPDKIIQAVQFYLDAGLTPTATAYLVGSLCWESGLDPKAVGDEGQSRGLNQWWVSRRKGLPNSFEGQLVYVLQEMQRDTLSSGTLKTLRTSHNRRTIKAALKRWTRWQHEGDRWHYAETILAAMNPDWDRAGS